MTSCSLKNLKRMGSVPLANANVSLDAATIKIEQLQMELNQRNTSRAMLPFLPRLLNAICAKGWPKGLDMTDRMSEPMQNAIVMMTAQPVTVAVNREDSMANGTAFAALDASSAIVADDSKPETTHTGVRKESMNAQPL